MEKIIVVCGPTATGKTTLALKLASEINGELISADSRQIYIGMDIGTGKDLPSNLKFVNSSVEKRGVFHLPITNYKLQSCQTGYYNLNNIKLWLYDIIEPNQTFSAFEFIQLAKLVIADIQQRGKVPIVVGGTGFYIKALIDGLETEGIEPDWELRKKLENWEIGKLKEELLALDPKGLERMNCSDRNNPRRLIRAIEITQNPKTQRLKESSFKASSKSQLQIINYKLHNLVFIGLTTSKDILFQRIDQRVDERVKQGIVEEIKQLLNQGYQWSDPGLNTLGYKEWRPFFENKSNQEEIVACWKHDEHNLAKRQLTWFKKDKRIRWFDITKQSSENIIKSIQKDF